MKYTKPEIEIQKFDIIEDVAASEILSSIDIDDSGEIGWEPIVTPNSVNKFNITQ